MAVSTLAVQSRTTMCSSEKCLRSALIFEAQRGYRNFVSKDMRLNNFLSSKMSTVFSRSKHKLAEKLLKEVDVHGRASVSDRSKLLNKILYSGAADMVSSTYIPDTFETETRQDLQFNVDKPSTLPQHRVKQNDGLVEVMLDQSISFIPGLSKRHSRQLENCGFHTLRKLLQHFPRTYADLQNAQIGIEDGQYLIFVGKILSSSIPRIVLRQVGS
nr:ATP-dependent DNA helicase homolog RECG, chloroplastic-like isoform X3 [Nicotiana tomentosiformis]